MRDSMIVSFWGKVFHFLRYVSVFQYVRMIPGLKGSHLFVEIWVLLNLFVSLLSMVFIQRQELPMVLSWVILIYSFTRVLEITVYQVNVLLFDPYQTSNYSVKSYRRLVILLLHNYVEVIFWFATSYMILSKSFNVVVSQGSIIETILFSFVTMVTFGSNSLVSSQNVGHSIVLILIQAIIGLFMTIVSLARVIGLLPKPNTEDSNENERNIDIEKLTVEIKQLKQKVEYFETKKRKKAR